MSEAVLPQIKAAPGEFKKAPVMAITIGVIFLVLVLVLEAFKPGILTGPIKALLGKIGIGAGA